MAVNNQSRYPLPVMPSKNRKRWGPTRIIAVTGIVGIVGILLVPQVITIQTRIEQARPVPVATDVAPFPVSVNPSTKSIVDNPQADALFESRSNDLAAAVDTVSEAIAWLASVLDNTTAYQAIAGVDGHLITIKAGYRKEEVLSQLVAALNWNKAQQQEFMTAVSAQTPGVSDGMFTPGTYVVDSTMTPTNVAALMELAFNRSILVHYSTSTAQIVSLPTALTIASLLEREAKDTTDMREISGIIWNRLFTNMPLQIDATLQYAKASNTKTKSWWPTVVPKDKYIKSAYNTYSNPGLPPSPIAEPSVAAVLAALNPVETSCLFYFHDKYGNFHCSDTYAQHVKLLKKYYGQGK